MSYCGLLCYSEVSRLLASIEGSRRLIRAWTGICHFWDPPVVNLRFGPWFMFLGEWFFHGAVIAESGQAGPLDLVIDVWYSLTPPIPHKILWGTYWFRFLSFNVFGNSYESGPTLEASSLIWRPVKVSLSWGLILPLADVGFRGHLSCDRYCLLAFNCS